MTIQFTTLVFTALHLGELVSSLIVDHDLPQELWEPVSSLIVDHNLPQELWERKVPACSCCSPEAAHQFPFGELVSLIQGLIVSPNGVNHQVLQRAAALGAITISDDLDGICGWDWTPAGLLVAKDIIGDMFSDEDTNTWSSPEGNRWHHSHGTRLSASGL